MLDLNNLPLSVAELLDPDDYPSFPCADCGAHVIRPATDPRNPESCKACNDKHGWPCGCCGDLTGGIDRYGQAYCGCDDDPACGGHPAGAFDSMGDTFYCDGSCRK